VSSLPRSEATDLSGRHIFLTGGTGFLGKTLLDYFTESSAAHGRRFKVTLMSRAPDKFLQRWPQYQAASWLELMSGSLEQFPPTIRGVTDVIHAAANTHDVSDQAQWVDQIVGGTRAALAWAAASGARRFLLSSSGAIYGPQPHDVPRLTETYHGAPPTTLLPSVYGQAKRVAEQLCTIYASSHRLEVVIARCFALIGPHLPTDGAYAIGNFIRDARSGDAIRVRGDGKAIRTYMFGRDMAHWLVTLLNVGANGEAYNVGSDKPIDIAQLAALVADTLSPGKPVLIEGTLAEDGSRSRYVPDIAKAQRLGLNIETPLGEAIRLSSQGA